MRVRLLWLLLGLMVVGSLALDIPLATSQAHTAAQEVFLDRLNDATRFASIAQQGRAEDEPLLEPELRQYDHVYGIRAALFSRDGKVQVASRPSVSPQLDEEAATRWLTAALGGRRTESPGALWPWDTRPLVVAEPVIDGGDVIGVIVTSSPTTTARHQVLRQWSVLALVEVVAVGISGLLALALTRWILRPVHRVDRAAHEIATGRVTSRVPLEGGPPELRRLASSFNEMADAVEEVLEQQQAFVADASHQLRNPLNALLLRLDDLAMRLPRKWSPDADLASEEGHRLAEMLEELLQLAQAERTRTGSTERIDLVAITEERMTVAQGAARSKAITVRLSGAPVVRVVSDRVAVAGALDVVLDNAVKFGPPGSTVSVVIEDGPAEVQIVVTDQGEGLDPDELARAGRRFWRSRRHQNVPGSGLGLSIAHLLLKPSGARLELVSGPRQGLQATLHVPKAMCS